MDDGLFDVPRVSAKVQLDGNEEMARDAEGRWGASNAKITDYRGKARKLCDDCTHRIHASKSGGHPLVATKKRAGPNGDLYLCPEDAQDRALLDRRAKQIQQARIARQQNR